jgi:hypothetical protein
MLLYLTVTVLFFYHTNVHGIIMDFSLNTILGEDLLARSCFPKRFSFGRSFAKGEGDEQVKGEPCVVSFQKKSSTKKPSTTGSKVLGSGLFSFVDQKNNKKTNDGDDDDETASTVDMYDDEYSVIASKQQEGRRSVQFEEELVTAIYTRPRTTKDDKYYLHYDEYDYMDFKLEYRDELLQQRQRQQSRSGNKQSLPYRRSPRKVSFRREVVESVHPVMDRNQRKQIQSDLFYSEEEMRSFLDEFVASLQKQSSQNRALLTS